MGMDQESCEVISPEEFMQSLCGKTLHVIRTDGPDLFLEFDDGKVLMVTVIGSGYLGLAQAQPETLQ